MAFEKICGSIARLNSENTKAKVFIAAYQANGSSKATNNIAITVRIGTDVLAKLGWTERCLLAIAEGTGADAGMLQLTPTQTRSEGHLLAKESKNSMVLRVSIAAGRFNKHETPTEPMSSDEVAFQTFGSALTVMLPAWMPPKG